MLPGAGRAKLRCSRGFPCGLALHRDRSQISVRLRHAARKERRAFRLARSMCRAHCERVERLIFGVMSNPSLVSKPDGVPKEPEPEIEHSPPRVTNLLLIDLRQEPGAHVVRDLR